MYSLGPELLLFSDGRGGGGVGSGAGSAVESSSGDSNRGVEGGTGVRGVVLHSRCLHSAEVSELASSLRHESRAGGVNQVSDHLVGMGVDPQIAHWAAEQAEGDTVDQRINSALNIVYS